MTRAYTVEVQTASVFYAQSLILLLFRSIDPLLSLEAVKHGHTISAVGVEPCTGRLYFSGLQMLGVLQLLGGPAHRAQGGVEPRGGGVHKIDLINYLRFLRCVHPVT